MAVAGDLVLAAGLAMWNSPSQGRFAAWVAVAALPSCCKVKLPGKVGTTSTNLRIDTLCRFLDAERQDNGDCSGMGVVTETYWNARTRTRALRGLFNVATVVLGSSMACAACRASSTPTMWASPLVGTPLIATAADYAINTVLVCAVLGLASLNGWH